MRKKSLGVFSLAAVLTLGTFTPGVAAVQPNEQPKEERLQIQIATVDQTVAKEDLIEKVKNLFPGKFDFLSDNDFQLRPSHRYPEDLDDMVRYNLYFSKEIKNNYIYGDFEFIGENLDLHYFNYQPQNVEDALFPAKVSQSEAEEIANAFLKRLANSSDYVLRSDALHYYPGQQQTLTEPIRYNFSYQNHKDGVPISDQHINIGVLGNGEIFNFSGPYRVYDKINFEDVSAVLEKAEIQKMVEENFTVDLQYFVDFDYRTQESSVRLGYLPLPSVQGVHGITGDWLVGNSFEKTIPTSSKDYKKVVSAPLEARQSGITANEARAFVEEFLNVDDIEGLTLRVDRVEETKNYRGQDVLRVDYMFERRNSGFGTSIELDKNTGEILNYHDIRREVLIDMGLQPEQNGEISYESALQKAIEYVKEYAPSYLHHFVLAVGEIEPSREAYHISFPRIENGILVSGQFINVGVNSDGSLGSFNVNYLDFHEWPAKNNILSADEAVDKYLDELELQLMYTNTNWEAKEILYRLVYTLDYGRNYFINAVTGEFEGYGYPQDGADGEKPVVENHWAEEELNFMINAGILKVADVETFSPDAATNKGEALEVIMKSLTRFYDYYRGDEELSHSFENIPPNHPLYQVVERAVNLGILDKDNDEFAFEEALTRQELAVWYIRALGLEEAAKHSSIFALDFKDSTLVEEANIGYVAVANALGILTESNGWFRPAQEVSLGQLSVSAIRLAKLTYSDNRFNRF